MGTPRKINAILLNIKINQRELANMCRYKMATYWQNFMEIYSTGVKILQKILGGLLFLTHTVYIKIRIAAMFDRHADVIGVNTRSQRP